MAIKETSIIRAWEQSLKENAQTLAKFACLQRWFRSKGRNISRTNVKDVVFCGPYDGDRYYLLTWVQFEFAEGDSEVYFLPLIAVTGKVSEPEEQIVLSFQKENVQYSFLDAFKSAHFEKWIVTQIESGAELVSEAGVFKFTPRSHDFKWHDLHVSDIRNLKAEQSNTSFIVRNEYILKIYRKLEGEPNPEVEMLEFLKNHSYTHVPQLAADIVYQSKEGVVSSVGLMVDFIQSSADGWNFALAELKNMFDDSGSDKDLLRDIQRIGQLTRELHQVLASDETDAKFKPETISRPDIDLWKKGYEDMVNLVMELKAKTPFNKTEMKSRLMAASSMLDRCEENKIQKIRYHGDFHLGQVLKGPKDWILFDFEGEPLRVLAERKKKASALKDVAGMLRSFSYAAHVSSREFIQRTGTPSETVDPKRLQIEQSMRDAFLNGYFEVSQPACFLFPERSMNEACLVFFELEKAVYELNYELNNRPDWAEVPLKGIQCLLEQNP